MVGKELYKRMAQPPKSALREIKGGRLAGMSDINPQWRYDIMTEVFGLCGVGWKYTIDRTWTEQGADGEVFCFVQVSLYIKDGDTWSEAIPAVGGNMQVMKERNRSSEGTHLYNNDECYKMALTDALGTAMQRIGVAADVYAGLWDGDKYAVQYDTPAVPKVAQTVGPVQVQKEPQAQKEYQAQKESRELIIAREEVIELLSDVPKEKRIELFKKFGGKIEAYPDGKQHWVNIDWFGLNKELKEHPYG